MKKEEPRLLHALLSQWEKRRSELLELAARQDPDYPTVADARAGEIGRCREELSAALVVLGGQPEFEAALAHSDMVLSSVRAALEGEPLNDFQLSLPLVRAVADLKAGGQPEPEKMNREDAKNVYAEGLTIGMELGRALVTGDRVRDPQAVGHGITDQLQRLGNIVANLAHPRGDHKQNDLEDEAHDILRELKAQVAALGGQPEPVRGAVIYKGGEPRHQKRIGIDAGSDRVAAGQPEPEKDEYFAQLRERLRDVMSDRLIELEAKLTVLAGQLAPLEKEMRRYAKEEAFDVPDERKILEFADTLAALQRSLEPK